MYTTQWLLALQGHVLNIRKDVIRESLSDFQGVEHRLEPVLKVRGVQYINDSKATNVNSTWYALESMDCYQWFGLQED
jgi:UDP-N-acetylmuramoylalanine--D-glutamate ligase